MSLPQGNLACFREVTLSWTVCEQSLEVKADGVVAKWNAGSAESEQIHPEQLICAVNSATTCKARAGPATRTHIAGFGFTSLENISQTKVTFLGTSYSRA